jgi:hypothetical protein
MKLTDAQLQAKVDAWAALAEQAGCASHGPESF